MTCTPSRHLILVRHAAVERRPGVPAHRWHLSADGRDRCRAFALELAPYPLHVLITSREPKAAETGQIMAGILGVPVHTAPGLHEHERAGVPYYTRQELFETAVRTFFSQPETLVFGEETAVQALHRFDRAVQRVLKVYAGNLALVAHGTVISLFLSRYNPGLDPFAFWKQLTLPCAFVTAVPGFRLLESR